MPIATSDIKLFKTTNGLGGPITATESTHNAAGNIFDTFSGTETKNGGTFYACLYVKNTHGTLTAENVMAMITSETDHAGVNASIALGSSAVNGVEQTIANENTAPTGVNFADTDSTTSGASVDDPEITLGNIPKGEHRAFWVRLTIDAATAAKTGYQINTDIDFDTAE